MKLPANDLRLRKLLHSKYAHPEPRRNPKTVHVSMLTKGSGVHEYCPRESAIAWRDALDDKPGWITTAERLTYDTGHFLQRSITEHLHAHLLGDWGCSVCGSMRRGWYELCRCGAVPVYHELYFRSPISGVMGSLDLVIDLNFGKGIPVEVKTIEKDEFKKLPAPKIEHRYQLLSYLRLLREVGEVDPWVKGEIETGFGYVLYICKGFGHYFPKKDGGVGERYSPFSEFPVTYEGNPAKDVDEMYNRAASYWAYRNADQSEPGPLPPRIFNCTNSQCKRAEHCVARGTCWSEPNV